MNAERITRLIDRCTADLAQLNNIPTELVEMANDLSPRSKFDYFVGDAFCNDEFSLQDAALYAAAIRKDYEAVRLIADAQVTRLIKEFEQRAEA